MDDDALEIAWQGFADALKENDRRLLKRNWIILRQREFGLSSFGVMPDHLTLAYQRQGMNCGPRHYGQLRGLGSGVLGGLLGL